MSSLTLFLEGAGLVIAGLLIRSLFSSSLGHRRRVQSVSDLLMAHYDIGALGASGRSRRPSPVYAAGFALLFTALLTFGASSIHLPGARPLQGPPLDEVKAELEGILIGLRARIASLSERLQQLTASESLNGGLPTVQPAQPKPRLTSAERAAFALTPSDARDSIPEPAPRVMHRRPVEEATRLSPLRDSSMPKTVSVATVTATSITSSSTQASRPEGAPIRAGDGAISSDGPSSSADSRRDSSAAVGRTSNTNTETDQVLPASQVGNGRSGDAGDGNQRGIGGVGKVVPAGHEKAEGAEKNSSDKPDPPGQLQKLAKIDRSDPNGKVERSERVDKADRLERVEKVEKLERPAKLERIERVEKIEKPERLEKVERIEKVERPTKPEKIEKVERVERVERPSKPEKPARVGR